MFNVNVDVRCSAPAGEIAADDNIETIRARSQSAAETLSPGVPPCKIPRTSPATRDSASIMKTLSHYPGEMHLLHYHVLRYPAPHAQRRHARLITFVRSRPAAFHLRRGPAHGLPRCAIRGILRSMKDLFVELAQLTGSMGAATALAVDLRAEMLAAPSTKPPSNSASPTS